MAESTSPRQLPPPAPCPECGGECVHAAVRSLDARPCYVQRPGAFLARRSARSGAVCLQPLRTDPLLRARTRASSCRSASGGIMRLSSTHPPRASA